MTQEAGPGSDVRDVRAARDVADCPDAEPCCPGEARTVDADALAAVRAGVMRHRRAGFNAGAVHALLRHLEAVGFDGAPRFHGLDDDGAETLEFIPGEIGVAPYLPWTADDGLLDSVADLQRRYFAAARTFVPPRGSVWPDIAIPDNARGPVVCHTDLSVENVVVRDGEAVAMINFDCACPVDPLYDVAVAARHWTPLCDPRDLEEARLHLDVTARFERFCGHHALDRAGRERVFEYALAYFDTALYRVRARVIAGHRASAALWDSGFEPSNRRARTWVAANRRRLVG
jgi:hypothetical protein